MYDNITGRGIIIAGSSWRYVSGPMWNEIARAQYVMDHDIDTLRHVLVTTIINTETHTVVQELILDESRGLNAQVADGELYVIAEQGTPEYEEILGTQLGRAVACLMISAFSRGTMRIYRIIPYLVASAAVELRFDIEPVIAQS